MKYFGKINDPKDIATKEYVDAKIFGGGGTESEDFIVEEGSSANWYYRKWDSGFAECWGKHQVKISNYTTVNGFYGFAEKFYLPFTFTETVKKIYNVQIGNGFGMPASGGMGDTASDVTIHGLGNAGGMQTVTAQIYVWGNWK